MRRLPYWFWGSFWNICFVCMVFEMKPGPKQFREYRFSQDKFRKRISSDHIKTTRQFRPYTFAINHSDCSVSKKKNTTILIRARSTKNKGKFSSFRQQRSFVSEQQYFTKLENGKPCGKRSSLGPSLSLPMT